MRLIAGLTQEQMAEKLGVTQGAFRSGERFGRGTYAQVITDYAERRTSESEYAWASLSLTSRPSEFTLLASAIVCALSLVLRRITLN